MATSNSKNSKKESKNIKALFSVICLCIISLGLIVYFSTNTKQNDRTVNENTTIVETTDVQHAVTVEETTVTTTKGTSTTQKKKLTTTQPATMDMSDTNTPYKSFYKYPMTETVLKGYSEELSLDDTMGDYRAHSAVDFDGEIDEKVSAINDGLVLDVIKDSMYGTIVVIDHGGKLVARYCGLKSVSVKKGKFVSIGEKIGTLGEIPCEAGMKPHLHFETKVKGKTVNPLDAMSKTE